MSISFNCPGITSISSETELITYVITYVGWFVGCADKAIGDVRLTAAIRGALPILKKVSGVKHRKADYSKSVSYITIFFIF